MRVRRLRYAPLSIVHRLTVARLRPSWCWQAGRWITWNAAREDGTDLPEHGEHAWIVGRAAQRAQQKAAASEAAGVLPSKTPRFPAPTGWQEDEPAKKRRNGFRAPQPAASHPARPSPPSATPHASGSPDRHGGADPEAGYAAEDVNDPIDACPPAMAATIGGVQSFSEGCDVPSCFPAAPETTGGVHSYSEGCDIPSCFPSLPPASTGERQQPGLVSFGKRGSRQPKAVTAPPPPLPPPQAHQLALSAPTAGSPCVLPASLFPVLGPGTAAPPRVCFSSQDTGTLFVRAWLHEAFTRSDKAMHKIMWHFPNGSTVYIMCTRTNNLLGLNVGEVLQCMLVSLDGQRALLLYPPNASGSLFTPTHLVQSLVAPRSKGSGWQASCRIAVGSGADAVPAMGGGADSLPLTSSWETIHTVACEPRDPLFGAPITVHGSARLSQTGCAQNKYHPATAGPRCAVSSRHRLVFNGGNEEWLTVGSLIATGLAMLDPSRFPVLPKQQQEEITRWIAREPHRRSPSHACRASPALSHSHQTRAQAPPKYPLAGILRR